MDNIKNMPGIQPELRRALTTLGSVAIPVGTPVNEPEETPGNIGAVCCDDDFLYIKTNAGWKRVALTEI